MVEPAVTLSAPEEARSGADSIRMGLVALTIGITSVFGVAASLLYPATNAEDRFTYAVVEPAREHFWAWHALAPANLVIGVCAIAVAGCSLARLGGAMWATAGAALMWLGAGFYGTGIAGLGPLYYFATDSAALEAAAGTRLLDHLTDQFVRLWGPAITGAVLVALGTVALCVALWRARTVPRWVPVVAGVSIVATFFADTAGALALLVEAPVALSSVAIGWYAWQRVSR